MSAETSAAISGTFHTAAQLAAARNAAPDITLVTPDGVSFYVHISVLNAASSNGFGGLLSTPIPSNGVVVARHATCELDLVLRVAYGIGNMDNVAPWESLTRAVALLVSYYKIPLPGPGNALFGALAAHVDCMDDALDLYAFAAESHYDALAVYASQHLLSFSLLDMTLEWFVRVGVEYVHRLYVLHAERTSKYQHIVFCRPTLHSPQPECIAQDMADLLWAWDTAAVGLIFHARAGVPNSEIEAALGPVAADCKCATCATAVRDRIDAIVQEWSAVKTTI
ncbi:hypothetical protein AURDEDRAFT_184232 [Auricularia subglabra TFB-10046 SS5]|nr:hypothetical protein AURDEDRAFT_184232 [Auricularia subglabra TFB-10046 SS5]